MQNRVISIYLGFIANERKQTKVENNSCILFGAVLTLFALTNFIHKFNFTRDSFIKVHFTCNWLFVLSQRWRSFWLSSPSILSWVTLPSTKNYNRTTIDGALLPLTKTEHAATDPPNIVSISQLLHSTPSFVLSLSHTVIYRISLKPIHTWAHCNAYDTTKRVHIPCSTTPYTFSDAFDWKGGQKQKKCALLLCLHTTNIPYTKHGTRRISSTVVSVHGGGDTPRQRWATKQQQQRQQQWQQQQNSKRPTNQQTRFKTPKRFRSFHSSSSSVLSIEPNSITVSNIVATNEVARAFVYLVKCVVFGNRKIPPVFFFFTKRTIK